MLSQFLRTSLVGFNGSNSCKKDNPEAFYESYLDRKRELIESNKLKYYKGAKVNWNKANAEVYLFNEAYQYKKEVLDFIKVLLKGN